MSIVLRFDGACKGNPGIGGSGAVVFKDNEPLHECYYYHSRPITNNIAEYIGLIGGLRMCLAHGYKNIVVQGDSKLVIEQVFGSWKCSHPNMKPLYEEAKELKKQFVSILGSWIPREKNGEADRLSNVAIYQKENKGHLDWFRVKSIAQRPVARTKTILEAFGIEEVRTTQKKTIIEAFGL